MRPGADVPGNPHLFVTESGLNRFITEAFIDESCFGLMEDAFGKFDIFLFDFFIEKKKSQKSVQIGVNLCPIKNEMRLKR